MAVTQDVRNKVVIRKLPPGISREEVQAAVDIVCQGKYDWFTFVPGKVRCAGCGNHSIHFVSYSQVLKGVTPLKRVSEITVFACSLKRIKHSRAYLNFLEASEVLRFRSQFAGHAFVNKKGAQYRCVVEYAPYQRIPREKAKEDPREGTYENGQSLLCTCFILKTFADWLPRLLSET